MMKVDTGIIKSNTYIGKDVYKMEIQTDLADEVKCGQFVEVEVPSYFLRRPISVCEVKEDHTIVLVYKVVGDGTRFMTTMHDEISLFGPCGNGFPVVDEDVLLIGGGVGVPPMYNLCKVLINEGKNVKVILGFNSADDVFYESEFKALGADVYVATADGSYGTKGFVTDVLKDIDYSYFYTCGPISMFKAIENIAKTSGQYSFEERMGCGFGACMGCSCKTKYKNIRICKDGPVLEREVIVW